MHVRTTMRYHFTSTRMAIIFKRKIIISVGKDVKKLDPLCFVHGNVKWSSHHRKQIVSCSESYTNNPIWTRNSVLRRILKRSENRCTHKCTCTHMSTRRFVGPPKDRHSTDIHQQTSGFRNWKMVKNCSVTGSPFGEKKRFWNKMFGSTTWWIF